MRTTATRDSWTRRARPENLLLSIEFRRFTGNPRWSECVIRALSHGLSCRDIIQCLNWDEYLVTLGDVWSAWSAQGFPQQQRRMRLVSVRPSAVSCFSWKSFRVQAVVLQRPWSRSPRHWFSVGRGALKQMPCRWRSTVHQVCAQSDGAAGIMKLRNFLIE